MTQPIMTTAHLRLAPVTTADTESLADLLAEPDVRRYLCDDEILPRETVVALIERSMALAASGLGLWSVATDNDLWIACVGLLPVSEAALSARPDFVGEVEPIIALATRVWGRGYAAEALSTAAAYGIGTLSLPRLVALVDEPNVRSHALLRRVGFNEIGTGPGPRHRLHAYEIISYSAVR
jgi:ribosomal-protein-alanine N-acetyltransferase